MESWSLNRKEKDIVLNRKGPLTKLLTSTIKTNVFKGTGSCKTNIN